MDIFKPIKKIFNVFSWGAYDATRPTFARAIPLHPWTDPRQEVSSYDRELLMKSARHLFYNSAEARMVVKNAVALTGFLMPLPKTDDEEFNTAAEKAFLARVSDPLTFEGSGRLDFKSLQRHIEERAIVDGDILVVLTQEKDGGGGVQVYSAPQVARR